jgi:hypothetical protein
LKAKGKTTLISNYHFTVKHGKAKIIFLKHISDCLRHDKVGDGIVDEVGGLDSIIKPFCDDLMDNTLFVARRKLRRMAPFAIFLAPIYFLLDPSTGRCL